MSAYLFKSCVRSSCITYVNYTCNAREIEYFIKKKKKLNCPLVMWQSATSPFSDVAQCHTLENSDVAQCHTLQNGWLDPASRHPTYPPPFFFLPSFSSPQSFHLSHASSLPLPCTSLLPCCSSDAAAPVTSSPLSATPQAISSFKLHIYILYIYNCTYWSLNIFLILFSFFLVFFLVLIYYKLFFLVFFFIFYFLFLFMIVVVVLVRFLIV